MMSVADQYLARAGVVVPVAPSRGVSASFGARLEGIPVRDAFGKSDGFRRPDYALSLEPGVNWYRSRGREVWSLSVAIPVERNRRQNVSDIRDNRHGDAAFADYVLVLGYGRRF